MISKTYPHFRTPLSHPDPGQGEIRRFLLSLPYPTTKWASPVFSLSTSSSRWASNIPPLILSQPLYHLNLDLGLRDIGLDIAQKENIAQLHMPASQK